MPKHLLILSVYIIDSQVSTEAQKEVVIEDVEVVEAEVEAVDGVVAVDGVATPEVEWRGFTKQSNHSGTKAMVEILML